MQPGPAQHAGVERREDRLLVRDGQLPGGDRLVEALTEPATPLGAVCGTDLVQRGGDVGLGQCECLGQGDAALLTAWVRRSG